MNTPSTSFVVDANGNKTAVILPLKLYKQLLEDLHDLAVIAERQEESAISLKEMMQRVGVHDELRHYLQTGR